MSVAPVGPTAAPEAAPQAASQAATRAVLTATPRLTPTPLPTQLVNLPTPFPGNSAWVQQRVNAVAALYNLTPAGMALLRSLDARQMRGEPGWFGSYGFTRWTGIGEAKPGPAMHEFSHSYWGGFPVAGRPDLSWAGPDGGASGSAALEQYHADALALMRQPPDEYEVFRQRLRNLPGVSAANTEPLFHSLEADLVQSVGGDLDLVPPILRKYWSQFLQPGPFHSWPQAAGWLQGLDGPQRGAAGQFLGFEHLDLRQYARQPSAVDASYLAQREITLAQEERQRLYDLADQFDLLLGDPKQAENFEFWRGYLRDKLALQREHPGYLAELPLARAPDLAAALDYLNSIASLPPAEQASRLSAQLPRQPFLVNLLPALDNRVLRRLFAGGDPLPPGATLSATASFVERNTRFDGPIQSILDAGRADSAEGAARLQTFLDQTGYDAEQDLRLFFDLLRDADPATARPVAAALPDPVIQRLIKPVPVQLRSILPPADLLPRLGLTPQADLPQLRQGVEILVKNASGNFIIDEPYDQALYEIISARSAPEQPQLLALFRMTPFPLEGFILSQPRAAASIFRSDEAAAIALIRDSDPVKLPPARVVCRLISADPALAAQLTYALEQRGETDLVTEALAYFAYDQWQLTHMPGPAVSLAADGAYLAALLRLAGGDWLSRRLSDAATLHMERARQGQVSPDFVAQYQATLAAAATTVAERPTRESLTKIINSF